MAETPNSSTGNGGAVIIAAFILGVAVVASSLLLRSSLDQGTAELAEVKSAVSSLGQAFRAGGGAPAGRQAAARPDPTRPDPNKRYTVNTKGSPAFGPENAPVEIVEFSDFQCPFCSRVTPTLTQIKEAYGDKVRVVFKHMPLSIHPKAPEAHAAAEAAHRQGKFWEMHDKLFANQRALSTENYTAWAKEIGLDVAKFEKDKADPAVKAKINQDMADAQKVLVRGTPAFFVNGRFLSGAQPFPAFKKLIDEELEEKG